MTHQTAGALETIEPDQMHVVEPRAAGLDVHKMQVTASLRLCQQPGPTPVCISREFSALPDGLRELTGWLQQHGVGAAAMEGTGIYWLAPYEALEEAGLRVSLYHARDVKQIKGKKTDLSDSRWLARICQFGLATPSYVPPRNFRRLRDLARYRRKLVGERSRLRNRVHKTLDRDGLRIGGILTDVFGHNGRKILDGLVAGQERSEILGSLTPHVRRKLAPLAQALAAELDPHGLWKLRDLLAAGDRVEQRIGELDQRLEADLTAYSRPLNLLETVPGIDRASARAILIELGADVTAFPNARCCGAWAGLCPGNDQSAGKRRSGRARKGNPTLRATLTECAQGAARTKGSQFYAYHRALAAHRGYKRAILATAYKLLRVIYALLRDDQPYRDPGIDYEALFVERNAPRWLGMLDKHGFLSELRGQTA